MTDKTPRPRTPQGYDTIERGALRLELAEMVKLRDKLTGTIQKQVADLETAAKRAKEIAGGGQA